MKFLGIKNKKIGSFILLLSLVASSLGLSQVCAYPAPQFQEAKVFSIKVPDGSISTIFYAIISGPSPIDVTSFTATGPAGPFGLTSRTSFQQYGLFYGYVESGIVNNGSYTLTLIDSMGRTASVVREFIYDDSIPTSTSLVPTNQTYTETTTPTLTFSPVAGDYCYQAQIRDYDQKAIWYNSPMMAAPYFTVPDGVLQPNTPYILNARIWDSAMQNCCQSQAVFYTGKKSIPEINMWGLLSFLG